MERGYPRLLGDIGGTNARWAWQPDAASAPQHVVVRSTTRDASIYDSAAAYLERLGRGAPVWAGIGVATPVAGDEVQLTNRGWAFSIARLEAALGVERCLVVNDFTALALSLPALGPADLRRIAGGGAARAGHAIALLGPGTGLGVSGLVPDGRGGFLPLAGEGGHATLAPADDHESELLARLRHRHGHVSAERVLSGPGLVTLYEVLCERAGRFPAPLAPAAVTDAALAGTDPQCVQALAVFTRMLGSVAGNLALTLGALGGVYIGGGIVPQLGARFDDAAFRRGFEEKGRFAEYLRPIPAWVVTAPNPALIGASRALDLLPR
jgi:glucokinase